MCNYHHACVIRKRSFGAPEIAPMCTRISSGINVTVKLSSAILRLKVCSRLLPGLHVKRAATSEGSGNPPAKRLPRVITLSLLYRVVRLYSFVNQGVRAWQRCSAKINPENRRGWKHGSHLKRCRNAKDPRIQDGTMGMVVTGALLSCPSAKYTEMWMRVPPAEMGVQNMD